MSVLLLPALSSEDKHSIFSIKTEQLNQNCFLFISDICKPNAERHILLHRAVNVLGKNKYCLETDLVESRLMTSIFFF